MKKLTLISVLAMLCVGSPGVAQTPSNSFGRLYIDSRLPDISLGKIINFKDSTALLSDFSNKLVILDFWFTACGACIAQFPMEEALQKKFQDQIQIITVTFEPKEDIDEFLKNWENKHGSRLTLPFIVADTFLNTVFNNLYFPHYIWIGPDRRVIAHTSEYFVNENNIREVLTANESIIQAIKKDPGIPDRGIKYQDLIDYYFRQNTTP